MKEMMAAMMIVRMDFGRMGVCVCVCLCCAWWLIVLVEYRRMDCELNAFFVRIKKQVTCECSSVMRNIQIEEGEGLLIYPDHSTSKICRTFKDVKRVKHVCRVVKSFEKKSGSEKS